MSRRNPQPETRSKEEVEKSRKAFAEYKAKQDRIAKNQRKRDKELEA